MKKILIPTDFSENAWNAIQYATELFKEDVCEFHFLNTYTPAIVHSRFMAVNSEGRLLEDTVLSASESGLKQVLERLSKDRKNPRHSFKTISSFSLLTEEIKETVSKLDIDIIIAGTCGASGLSGIFLGSNAVRIIKTTRKCPVIVVPNTCSFKKPMQIAFVTDFKRNFDAAIIDPLKKICKHFGATIRIMHIQEERQLDKYQSSNLNILQDYLESVPFTLHWMPPFSSKSIVIRTFVEELDIDMLAMVHYKHGFLEELTREPVIKKVAFNTQIPLLAIPD